MPRILVMILQFCYKIPNSVDIEKGIVLDCVCKHEEDETKQTPRDRYGTG